MARACGSLRLSASPERGRYGRRAAPRAHGRRLRRRRLRRGRPRRVTIKKLSGARAAWLRRAGRVVERAGREVRSAGFVAAGGDAEGAAEIFEGVDAVGDGGGGFAAAFERAVDELNGAAEAFAGHDAAVR